MCLDGWPSLKKNCGEILCVIVYNQDYQLKWYMLYVIVYSQDYQLKWYMLYTAKKIFDLGLIKAYPLEFPRNRIILKYDSHGSCIKMI